MDYLVILSVQSCGINYQYYHDVYCTISEYAAKGCLYDHLANNKLNFEQILRWSTEIALGKQVSVYIIMYQILN